VVFYNIEIKRHGPAYSIVTFVNLSKGQSHKIFNFRSFFMNRFSQAPEYPIRAVSNLALGALPMSLTLVATGKNLQSKKF
jgi:hypothetical protein